MCLGVAGLNNIFVSSVFAPSMLIIYAHCMDWHVFLDCHSTEVTELPLHKSGGRLVRGDLLRYEIIGLVPVRSC